MSYVCCVCPGGRESTFEVSFIYLSLNISPYPARSHTLSLSHSLRPQHQQARMRIAAHAERVCGTEESGWPQTLRCLPQYALRIVCDSVCRRARTHDRHTHTHTTHTHNSVCLSLPLSLSLSLTHTHTYTHECILFHSCIADLRRILGPVTKSTRGINGSAKLSPLQGC
jgi:hypothetical protein